MNEQEDSVKVVTRTKEVEHNPAKLYENETRTQKSNC